MRKKKNVLLKDKILFTLMIILIYILCRSIPLYGLDVDTFLTKKFDAQVLLTQTISGDLNQKSILALGISPYMMASIPVMIMSTCRNSEAKARTSQYKLNRIVVCLVFLFAVLQAITRLQSLQFTGDGCLLIQQKVIAGVQMVAGAFIIMWLSRRNKLYGIGGQTALIYINIIDGIKTNLIRCSAEEIKIVLSVAVLGMAMMLMMENTEKRIPVQRISIHNIYSDKNYHAIKMNPIGIMPIMFSSAFFMLPQMICSLLLYIWPDEDNLLWFRTNCVLTKPLGVAVYLFLLMLLTIGFSFLMLNPNEIAEQYLKSGDSLINIQAGKDTKKYFCKQIIGMSFMSGLVMGLCTGIPLILQFFKGYNASLVLVPSSFMMLTGIWCNIYQEVEGVNNLDSYQKFIDVM